MTEKQRRFCEEYIIDLHITQAAIRAGYSEKTAYSIGSENLKKPEIQSYIAELTEQLRNERTADAQEVLEYLTAVMRGEEKEEKMAANALGELAPYSVKNQNNQIKAAELLGKRFGLFTEKVDVNGNLDEVLEAIKNA